MKLVNNNIKKAGKRVLLAAIPLGLTANVLATLYSCSDDHFDIKADTQGNMTLWQNIKNDANLSEYADILENVKYSKSEEQSTEETYAQLFDGEQTFTVWAPKNGTFDYAYYKSLLESGIRDSIYKVERNLIRNNMARYTYIFNRKDSVKIDLFNAKTAWLNHDNVTIKGQKVANPNIGASNGVLHIVDAPIAYQPNLYEYMATRSDLDSINKFIKYYEKKEFDEYRSIPGPTVDGKKTWVDSVSNVYNMYTNTYLGAYINREDSNYVMILPTNKAWENASKKTSSLYNYKEEYKQSYVTQTSEGKDTTISNNPTVMTKAQIDSLKRLYTGDYICLALAYNANWQYRQIPITSLKDLSKADSLLSTRGYVLKKTGTLNQNDKLGGVFEVDDYPTFFGGKEPIECSNGYAYIVDDLLFPYNYYNPTIIRNGITAFESHNNLSKDTSPLSVSYSYKVDSDDSEFAQDTIYKYTVYNMEGTSSISKNAADFRIRGVRSCKYDIYVVVVYNYSAGLRNKFRAKISYDTEAKRISQLALENPDDTRTDAKGKNIGGTKYFINKEPETVFKDGKFSYELTDTICLAKDFEFPVCYYDIENAYPVITLEDAHVTSEKNYYTNNMWVNAFIFKPKESTTEPTE